MAQRLAPQGQTIAVTSGKGGVGKTNLAVNLAATLAAMRRRVVLLDADLGLANADILANVQPRYNLAHVVAGQRTLAEVMVPTPAGFSLIAGASGLARMADLTEAERRRLVSQLETLRMSCDALIIDTGAGIGRNVLAFAAPADHIAVVTTPEPTAITDAYAVIKVLVRCGATGRMSVMVNQVRNREEARIVHERVASVARQFLQADITFGGYVVSDAAVQQAVRKRTTFVQQSPHSHAAQCVAAWAHRMDAHVETQPAAARSFFSRLAGWWR